MQPRISVRHERVSMETKAYIAQSCGKLERYCDRIVDCGVIIDKDKKGYRADFIVKVPQQTLAATGTGYNLYKAISDGESKVEGQLKKYHDKLVAR
jgi:ribosomal subunit interface protein